MRKKSVLIGGGLGYCYKRWMSSSSSEGRKRSAAVWGNGDYGRLGYGNLDSMWRPKLMNSSSFHNSNLKSISCGGAHTLFLTETGRVYATGLNDFGQLGISNNTTYCMEPLEVSGLKKEIVQISAGYHHSCAITVDGELYMWGKNSNGQLGLGKKAENVVPVPTKVECLSGINIKMVALASEHSIAVTDGGQALSWGGGGSGRLGHGHQSSLLGFFRSSSEYTPRHIKKLDGVKVKNIAAGLLHSACIDENGSVYIFGEKAVDKLAFGDANNTTTPSMIGKLPYSQEVACGGYHTCVITSNFLVSL
ncbi:ultraviolet-B receptor UVR8 isoform X3 [Populus alba x Populus x berolinensis]|uniref:Ultraviolet-B receptor UVR8 isoform X3 n=1 Tax=Populus alba x Populus x berolinensis TaxID=444605 RepID=A0AAD6QU00_9ROSI|nr:ultraviolet-B receptor UVR8 isoform X3 [Populus alba x Populus x berolinensis]